MAPDGKSLITSVGTQDSTVWMHDSEGDHQISSEGYATAPRFSFDGRSLYFLLVNGQTTGQELWTKDLATGKVDRVLPGYSMEAYTVSRDAKEIAFVMKDKTGRPNLWVAPTSRRSSPRNLSAAVIEDSPLFLPDGELVVRAIEGGSNYLYRMKTDGSQRRRITQDRILDSFAVSPDGRWVAVTIPGPGDDRPILTTAYATDGTAKVALCTEWGQFQWDNAGKTAFLAFPALFDGTYALPIMRNTGLPKLPRTELPGWTISGCENPCGDPMDCQVRSQSLGLRLRTSGDSPQSLPHPAAISIGWTPPIAFANEISGTVPGARPSRRCSLSETESRAASRSCEFSASATKCAAPEISKRAKSSIEVSWKFGGQTRKEASGFERNEGTSFSSS